VILSLLHRNRFRRTAPDTRPAHHAVIVNPNDISCV
jgi:hypothetical protein